MKSIVIGATGYIGSRLLVAAGAQAEAVGTSSKGGLGMPCLELMHAAEFDYSLIGANDVIYLTAGISAPDKCASDYERAYAVNVAGTAEFITKSLDRGARIIFFSSDTVYGESHSDVDENSPCHPFGAYARMKREVEERFASVRSFKVIRLSFVFSRRDQFTQYLLKCARLGTKAELFHPFNRAVIYLEDVVNGLMAWVQKWDEIPAQVINFGGPNVVSRADFAETLRTAAAPSLAYSLKPPPPTFLANRPGTIRMVSPRLELLLGRPARCLAEAVKIEFGRGPSSRNDTVA